MRIQIIESAKDMKSFFNSIMTIVILSLVVFPAKGLSWRMATRRSTPSGLNRVTRSNRRKSVYFGSLPPVALRDKIESLGDEQESGDWTMEEDWALIDNLPLFTVSSTTETRTFWTQLWSTNALLFSTKEPEDLYRRALQLENQTALKVERKLQNAEKNYAQQGRSLTFGTSPPVLENWKIDSETKDNKVMGQVVMKESVGKRTIWFRYHVMGRLAGDPFADKSSSTVPLFPGGFIEAVGGRVYELGQPMLYDGRDKEEMNIFNNNQETIDVDADCDESSTISRWWGPGSTAAISALVSSTILSACIGYGAGLSIIQDSSYHHQSMSPTPTMLTVETVLAGPQQNEIKTQQQSSSSGAVATATKSSTISDNYYLDQKPSIEELRSRTQYKVLREERLLNKISQRLELDKQSLKQLEEQQQKSSQLRP
jgi:hypothetical protein